MASALRVGLLLLAVGCGDRAGTPAAEGPNAPAPAAGGEARPGDRSGGRGGGAVAGSAQPAAPQVALADEPRIDLVDNRFLWHLYRDGLYVPLAGEGFRKYAIEYSDPWGRVIEADGKRGRVLRSRGATLHVPHESGGAATLLLRVHGAASGQRLTLHLNEKKAYNVSLEPGWQIARVPLDAGALKAGENSLRLSVGKRGNAGGEATYGLWHSLELAPADAPAHEAWPPLSPVNGDALTGFSRMAMLVEVPPSAHLRLSAQGGPVSAKATTVAGDVTPLFDGAQGQQTVSLAPLAGELVRLELTAAPAARTQGLIGLEQAGSRPRPAPAKNGIVFVVDALRSDKLAVYDPKTRVQTPRITKAAREYGAVMLHNQAASPSSPPSHGSLQTGMIPRVHGVAGDSGQLEPGTPMMSTVLGDAGVATAYYGNNPFGMARLEKPGKWTEFHQPTKEGHGIDCTALVREMLDFTKRQHDAGKRWFISALPYEPHTPYRWHDDITPKYYKGPVDDKVVGRAVDGVLLTKLADGTVKLSDDQWAQLKALYDGEVEHLDGCFGQLVDGLAEQGQLEDTAIILTSDHGEGMFEHGRGGHAYGNYAELGNVPFVILYPRLLDEGVAVDTVTSHLDIAPTLIDLMGVEPPEAMQGMSVVPLALRRGPWTPRVMSLEYGRSFGIRARGWKYLRDYQQTEELYDLAADPTEQTNLKETSPMALRYMRDLTGFFLAHRSDWKYATWGALNDHDDGFLRHVGARLQK